MPNRDWGRDDDGLRDERWRRDMGRDFSRHEWSPYDRERDTRDLEMREREREMRDRERRGDYRESGFGFGGTDRDFGGGGYGGYGNYGERGYGERGYGERGYGERGYGARDYGERGYGGERGYERGYGERDYGQRGFGQPVFRGPSIAERSLGDRGGYRAESRDFGPEYWRDYRDRPMGRPPKGYQRSDERIKEDVCDRLMHSWVDAENVEIEVRSGEVLLAGSVEDRQAKREIEDIAAHVLGVKDVQNSIRVRPPGGEQEQQRPSVGTTSPKKPSA